MRFSQPGPWARNHLMTSRSTGSAIVTLGVGGRTVSFLKKDACKAGLSIGSVSSSSNAYPESELFESKGGMFFMVLYTVKCLNVGR